MWPARMKTRWLWLLVPLVAGQLPCELLPPGFSK